MQGALRGRCHHLSRGGTGKEKGPLGRPPRHGAGFILRIKSGAMAGSKQGRGHTWVCFQAPGCCMENDASLRPPLTPPTSRHR